MNQAIQISVRIRLLLHQKERWKTLTRPRLLEIERDHYQKPVSPPAHL